MDIPKKRGAPAGHPGWFRRRPKKADIIEEVSLDQCPNCRSKELSPCQEVEEHLQEDILLPPVVVTMYRKRIYWCRRCKKKVCGRGKMELPNSFVGPIAKSIAVWLKYDVKISDRDLKRLLQLFQLDLVPASLAGFRNQLCREAKGLYEALKQSLQKSAFAYVDETGWKVNGILHQLWSASNQQLSVFMIHKNRSTKALQELLGEKFDGKLISDFLAVYHRYQAKAKQKCNIHLLRELKKILKSWAGDAIVQKYAGALKDLIQKALDLKNQWKKNAISDLDFQRQRDLIKNNLSDFEIPHPDRKPLQRIAKRLSQYKDELLTFLYDPDIEGHNNHAERQIRPNVLLRKITFGNHSLKGAYNHSVLMSLLATAKLQDKNPAELFKRIWIAPAKKRTLHILGLKPQAP